MANKMELNEMGLEEGQKQPATATATIVPDLSSYAGKDILEKWQNMVKQHDVVVFSKSHCPFCIEVKKTFAKLNVPITVLEVNKSKDGPAVHSSLKKITNQNTVPSVFIKGRHVGGCDDVKKLQNDGELDELVKDLVVKEIEDEGGVQRLSTIKGAKGDRGKAQHPLFWFPNVVNNYVVRLTGAFVCITCAIIITYRDEEWAHWLNVFLLADFITRMVFGSYASIYGMVAQFLVSPFKPQFKPGPPKQFAAACGTMFSMMGVGFFFAGYEITGACIIGGLMGASGLEGFGNFCLGCLFFSWGIQFKIFPDYLYRIYANTKDNVIAAWDWSNIIASKSSPPKEVAHVGAQTKADLKYGLYL